MHSFTANVTIKGSNAKTALQLETAIQAVLTQYIPAKYIEVQVSMRLPKSMTRPKGQAELMKASQVKTGMTLVLNLTSDKAKAPKLYKVRKVHRSEAHPNMLVFRLPRDTNSRLSTEWSYDQNHELTVIPK
jgi:hypothetical protein